MRLFHPLLRANKSLFYYFYLFFQKHSRKHTHSHTTSYLTVNSLLGLGNLLVVDGLLL
jgi:hypothetical protein